MFLFVKKSVWRFYVPLVVDYYGIKDNHFGITLFYFLYAKFYGIKGYPIVAIDKHYIFASGIF